MRYRDKSSNRTVVLSESGTSFLIVAHPDEKERIGPVLFDQKVFTVSPSTNDDVVFIVKARSDHESLSEIEKAVSINPLIISFFTSLVAFVMFSSLTDPPIFGADDCDLSLLFPVVL